MAFSLWLLGSLAGCCGGAPSHKCEFGPPTQKDASPEVGLPPCGSEECKEPTPACCVKVPLEFSCVSIEQYQSEGCMDSRIWCTVPKDCPGGLVCCATPAGVFCTPEGLCAGDGTSSWRACATSDDCPPSMPICIPLESLQPDAGTALAICMGG